MMKRLVYSVLSLLLLFALLLPTATHAATPNYIQLYLNGKKLNPEVPPILLKDTTMIPVRIVSESFGAKVSWNEQERKVTVIQDGTIIVLTIDKKEAVVGGSPVALEQAATIVGGNTLVPARFVAEHLRLTVEWDEVTQSVNLLKKVQAPDQTGGTPTDQPSPIVIDPGYPENGPTAPVSNFVRLDSMQMTGDLFTVQGSGAFAAKIFYLASPDRLVIDMPGTTYGQQVMKPDPGTMGQVWNDNGLISSIRYAMNAPETSTMRVVIDLKGKVGYDVLEDGSTGKVVVRMKHSTARYKVVIDAGHGNTDPGAISKLGRKEKDFNLSVALKVIALLKKEPMIDVYATRTTNVFVPLNDRVTFANNLHANLFLSIHANSFMSYSNGTQTYYYNQYSKAFADVVHRRLVAATGFRDDKVRFADYRVIRGTNMPGILLEVGYMSNSAEEAQLFQPQFQDRVAASIAAGIKEQLGIR
jgi:N-acetylmuramoyl-L-alanine amidase